MKQSSRVKPRKHIVQVLAPLVAVTHTSAFPWYTGSYLNAPEAPVPFCDNVTRTAGVNRVIDIPALSHKVLNHMKFAPPTLFGVTHWFHSSILPQRRSQVEPCSVSRCRHRSMTGLILSGETVWLCAKHWEMRCAGDTLTINGVRHPSPFAEDTCKTTIPGR